jgi:hypothetical protein
LDKILLCICTLNTHNTSLAFSLSLCVRYTIYTHTHTHNSITYNVDDDSSDNFSSRIQTKHYDDYIFEKIIIKQQKDIIINDDHESANVARRAEKTRRV